MSETRAGWPGLVLVDGEWIPYYDREEMLGERPSLDPLVDLENPDVCESCQ